MKLARLFGALFLLTALAATLVDACPPVVIRQRAYVAPYVAPIVATPIVAVQTYAVPVVVPLYTAAYGGVDQSTAALLAEIRQLRETVRGMQAPNGFGSQKQFQQPPAQMPPAEDNVQAALLPSDSDFPKTRANCAACHSGGNAKGSVKMFDNGKRLQLPPENLGDAIESVVTGKMPKNRRLTDTEVRAVLVELIK